MEGMKLAAKFSAAPNSLGLCGPKDFDMLDSRKLEAQLQRFLAPYTYLSIIAKANRMKPFDYRVVEAFWIGNNLLDSVKANDVANAIKTKFTGKGRLAKARAKLLAACLPAKVYPHHSFHVFYVGSISGVLGGNRKKLDLCRVSWGRVTRAGKGKISVCSKPVAFSKSGATLGRRKAASWCTPEASMFKVGGIACSHWGRAIVPLTSAQQKNLEKYTRLNLKLYSRRPHGA